MARGKKREEEDEGQAPKGGPTHAAKRISKGKLLELLKDKRSAREYTAEMNGTVAQKIGTAVENFNLNKKAFGWLSQIDRMEPERAKALVDDFNDLLETSGIKDKLDKIQRLPLNDDDEKEDEEGDGKVAKFPDRQAAE